MKTSIMATGLTLSMLAGSVLAGSVSTDNWTSFETGTAISASEMNNNFNAVTGAVNGNADDISTLNSTISSLQSTIATMENSIAELTSRMDTNDAYITLEELTGKTYCLISQNTSLAWDDTNNWARVNVGNDARTFTFTSSSEATLGSGDYMEAELGFGVGYESDYVLNAELATYTDAEASQSIGISSFSSGKLSLDVGIDLYVSKRGDVIIGRELTEDTDGTASQKDANLIVMVQCQ